MPQCKEYRLTVKIVGDPGRYGGVRVDGGDMIKQDEVVKFEQPEWHEVRAKAGKGATFNQWYEVGKEDQFWDDNPCRVLIDDDITITAVFEDTEPVPEPKYCLSICPTGHPYLCELNKGHKCKHRATIEW